MSEYKLHYFNARGRAEVARLIFALSDVKYEDIRYELADWPNNKQKFQYGKLPVLEIDGKQLNQSTAIFCYLARKYNLLGHDELEAAQCHAVIESLYDVLDQLRPKVMHETDYAKRVELMKSFIVEIALGGYGPFETQLANSHSGYIVGNKLTVADLAMFHNADTCAHLGGAEALKAFPHILKHHQKIGEISKIKHWVATRPQTQM